MARHFFISYSRQDYDVALRLKADLEQRGFSLWMDLKRIPPGTAWDDEIRDAIKGSLAVLYLVSPDSRASRIVAHELDLADAYKRPIWPLWVKGDEHWAEVVMMGYSRVQYIDLREAAYTPGLENLGTELKRLSNRTRVLPIERFTSVIPRNPYKGLHAFEYKDARDFFGRHDLVKSMIQQIRSIIAEEQEDGQHSRCMLVVSASGAGKSSTVLAGLLPALQHDTEIVPVEQRQIAEVERWLFLDPVRPGDKPIAGLIRALNRPFLNSEVIGDSLPLELSSDSVQKTLDESSLGLYKLLQQIKTNARDRLVLTIDQLEELFAPTVDEGQQKQFIELLFATATQPHSNVLIIATLRADFYDHVLKDPHLFAIMKAHRMEVPPMRIQDLREVIEKPIELEDVGVTFEMDLVGDLLYDVRRQPDALPLLQFTLAQLFEHREGRCLTRRSYEEIGRLKGALEKHADATYNNLPDEQHRASAKKLFTSFFINVAEVQNNASYIEFAEGVTSRRVTRAELLLDDPNSQRIRDRTLEAFTNARLLIVRNSIRQGQEQEDTTYEICHEVLISAWKRLQDWIEEDLQDIYFLQRLRPRIQQWQKGGIDKTKQRSLLSTDHELEQLQRYQQTNELSHSETEFLKQSLRWQRRLKQRTTGLFLATISLTLVVALVAGVVGYQRFGYLIFPSPTTVTTVSNSGPGSLRSVLAQAPDGATITFSQQLSGQTIQLTEDLPLKKRVTVQGLQDGTISISSGRTGKGIAIPGSKTEVTFNHIAFVHSYTHRASLITNHGILTLTDCQLNDNQSYGLGGGAIANYNRLILNRTLLTHNQTSGNGGAINDLFGIVTLNNSAITGNIAYNNGGGIYSQGGHIEMVESKVFDNQAQLPRSTITNNYGGGIDVVNGSLNMFSSQIFHNTSAYYGGGIALQGSLATINDSIIHDNAAGVKGGGLIVTKDTDNNFSSLAVLSNIVVTEEPLAQYYIGQNTAGTDKHGDEAAGQQKSVGDTIQIADDDRVATAGNPPPNRVTPPEQTANYLGVAHINEFCQQQKYSYGNIGRMASIDEEGLNDIQVSCFTLNNERMHNFSGKEVCGTWFRNTNNNATIVDRLTNYFDPSSLQCYKNLKRLGPLGNNAADFDAQCKKDSINEGLYDNPLERHTAYDWSCQPKDHNLLPIGLSVANACDTRYRVTNAIDRLVNYNSPAGWECWQPA
ncbi:hypothetical protein KSF_093640 [Reticulibacter mediterranei]|uniref:TIR domain-containing protein n=1 Tax=Reticulibacter mediterranei TaxID=2778369 RepID=A0A8J3J0F0_9CHLR|nr:TIR domain-containing protein [Reticulibacter mediterranei]GHO99316.1 hypothetical protein KSF_093640 [Reticulibacter mediterranei]